MPTDLMQSMDDPNKPLLNAVLRGSFVALAIQSVSTILLLAVQHSGRGQFAQVGLVGLASFAVASVGGFVMIARHVRGAQAVIIGIAYFPTMFGLMFLEAVILDARLYGNTF